MQSYSEKESESIRQFFSKMVQNEELGTSKTKRRLRRAVQRTGNHSLQR